MNTRANLLSLGSGVVVAGGLILYMLMFTVRQNQDALVFTFGKPSAPLREPGLYLKWPWPIQKVERLDRSIRIFDGTFEQTLTADGKSIVLLAYLCWRIDDPLRYWNSEAHGKTGDAEKLLRDLARNVTNNIVPQHPLNHLISPNSDDVRIASIEQEVQQGVATQASRYGIEVLQFGIKRLALPESTIRAVFEHMRTTRERIANAIIEEGKREANEIRAKAQEQASRVLAEAERQAEEIRAEGDAEAATSYKELERNPQLAQFLRQLQSLKTIIQETESTTLIVTPDLPAFSLLRSGPPSLDKPGTGQKDPKSGPAQVPEK